MSDRNMTTGRVGHKDLSTGNEGELRLGFNGEAIVSGLQGRYAELSRNGLVYFVASQAATTWTIALATTYTGIVVYNPVGSGKSLSILRVGFGLSVAPAGIATMGIIGGLGITTHTTPLTPYNAYLGGGTGVGKGDAASTLTNAPIWMDTFMGGFTAGALPSTSPAVYDVAGLYTVPPGYYLGIGALTVVVGFASIAWTEIPN